MNDLLRLICIFCIFVVNFAIEDVGHQKVSLMIIGSDPELVELNKTMSFDYGSPVCDLDYCEASHTTYKKNFACSLSTDMIVQGNWSDGIRNFSDPSQLIPVTTNETYILTQVGIYILGSFACKFSDVENTNFSVSLQGTQISAWSIGATVHCGCPNCVTGLNTTSKVFFGGWPKYNYGGTNVVKVDVTSNIVCITSIALVLYFARETKSLPIPPNGNKPTNVYYGVVIGAACTIVVVILVTTVVMISKHHRKRNLKRQYERINDDVTEKLASKGSAKSIDFLIKPGEIKLGPRIGKGSYGEVFRAEWRGIMVAIKKLPLSALEDEKFLRDFNQEAVIMSSLRHPNIIQMLGTCMIGNDVTIMTEYMNRGSLYRLLHDSNVEISWQIIKRFALETAQGMLYLHQSTPPVLHRDLKSHNLLVDSNYRLKITDFGLSKVIGELNKTMTSCGTAAWAAPEVLRNSRYTEKADVYSYGVVLWELYTREDPYFGMPAFQIIFSVGTEGLRPVIPLSCPPDFSDLIRDCWHSDPQHRPSFDVIIQRLKALS
eukprot:TRINITY_DN716_c2_g1_i1.p1 TRINITY_DN716_c2_g1~~TRINITY_DN716_c2_g1_i1.p1  ORF type:complete len:545 (+),score=115.02 TRINITY_DN716_c2_g1_i1:74-1708(+)